MQTNRTPQPLDNDGQDLLEPPLMPFLEMLNGPEGLSTIRDRRLSGFVQQVVSSGAAPIWMRGFQGVVKAIWFNVLPVGWFGDWHPSPSCQWVVPLSGRWYIETQDGKRIEMGPGDIHWGADVGGREMEGPSGHLSGQVGDVPCVQLMIQFESVTDTEVVSPGTPGFWD